MIKKPPTPKPPSGMDTYFFEAVEKLTSIRLSNRKEIRNFGIPEELTQNLTTVNALVKIIKYLQNLPAQTEELAQNLHRTRFELAQIEQERIRLLHQEAIAPHPSPALKSILSAFWL